MLVPSSRGFQREYSTENERVSKREPHPEVESLLSFCYCGKMWGWSHKLVECSKNLWKETTKSLRDMRIHFGYEMPHDTACKQIICMWGGNGRFFTTGSRWLQNIWNKCLHILQMPVCHIKPLFETFWKRISRVSKDIFYVTLGQMPESELVPSAPLSILLRVTQVLCIIHHPLHMHRVACTLASRLLP